MKTFKISLLTGLFIFVLAASSYCQQVGAQASTPRFDKRWSLNISGGSMLFYGDLRQKDFYPNSINSSENDHKFLPGVSERKWGFGMGLNKLISPLIGMQLQFHKGKLAGYKKEMNAYFNADIVGYGVNFSLYFGQFLFPNIDNRKYHPYIMGGFNLASYRTQSMEIEPLNNGSRLVTDTICSYGVDGFGTRGYDRIDPSLKKFTKANLKEGKRSSELSYPLGVGIRYKMNDHFEVGIETLMHFVNTDWLDGRAGSKTSSKDKYQYTSITFTYKISSSVIPFFQK